MLIIFNLISQRDVLFDCFILNLLSESESDKMRFFNFSEFY